MLRLFIERTIFTPLYLPPVASRDCGMLAVEPPFVVAAAVSKKCGSDASPVTTSCRERIRVVLSCREKI
jgi:hypothetical protein